MATFIEDLTLKAMAEDIAYLGKQDPKLTLCPMGVINAYSKENLQTPQVQIDFRQHLQAAWPVLLDQLRERNIPIPPQLQTPHFFGLSEQVCVTTTRKALEVSAWMVDLGSFTWRYAANVGYWISNEVLSIVLTSINNNTVNIRYPKDTIQTKHLTFGYGVRGQINIKDDDYTDASALKASLQGQYIIYQLADPIRINYSDLGLPDINSGMIGITTDHILTLSDTDGLEMHRLEPVEWTDEEGQTHPALITRWSKAYMDKHQAWPPALPMTYTGLQFTADYKEMRWLHDTVLKLINKYPV